MSYIVAHNAVIVKMPPSPAEAENVSKRRPFAQSLNRENTIKANSQFQGDIIFDDHSPVLFLVNTTRS